MIHPQDVDVLVLAAGFGTRLRPLTLTCPKPLLKVQGRELLDWNLSFLAASGFKRVFVNAHYLAEQISAYVGDGSRWGVRASVVVEPDILETGGAIRNIQDQIQARHLLIFNGDTLIGRDFSFESLLSHHSSLGAQGVATLVLRPDKQSHLFGELGLDNRGIITRFLGTESLGIGRPGAAGQMPRSLMFAGIHILSTEVIEEMPPRGVPFSMTRDFYQPLVGAGRLLGGVCYEGFWSDVGTPEALAFVEESWEGSPASGGGTGATSGY